MSLEQLVHAVGSTLKYKHLRLAAAESCTGGGLSYWLTQFPGSSLWFECGFITYSNEAKIKMLSIDPQRLEAYGAVSEETATQMAAGALSNSRADISIAITGIAGPDGGTVKKPVGMVWIACAERDKATDAAQYYFSGSRQTIREQSILQALQNLLNFLADKKYSISSK